MVLQGLLLIDVCSRQVAQARRIALLDNDLAMEFLHEGIETLPNPRQSLSQFSIDALAAVAKADQLYENLIGPYRWNGSFFN